LGSLRSLKALHSSKNDLASSGKIRTPIKLTFFLINYRIILSFDNNPMMLGQCDILAYAEIIIDLCHQKYFRSIESIDIIHNLDKLKDFKEYFRQKDHPSIAKILSDIANIISETSLSQLSLPFLMEQLRIEKYYLGCYHPDLASVLFNIGHIYEMHDKLNEAKKFFTEALLLLDNHKRKGQLYASVIYNIGLVNYRQSLYVEAMKDFDVSIIEYRALYDEFHHAVARVMMKIAFFQLEIGRLQDAMNNFLEALTILRVSFGNDHSEVAKCIYGVALVHEARAEYKESLNALHRAFNINENAEDDDDDTFTLVILHRIGLIYQSTEDGDRAHKIFENLKNIIKLKCGDDDTAYELISMFGLNIDGCSSPAAAAA